ncbi:hypothetical protein Xen7305DRAFT_00040990 [Xenococcus sp. PCC 7305]|nr:hypothetical protein Xen7305DRAFT_00040990 [Xenococcus sp. PCC 7305]
MWIEPPPKPPQETEQTLAQLAHYYRQLITYHQQAAAIASSKLSQVDALITASSFSSVAASWQYPTASPTASLNRAANPELTAEIEEVPQILPEIKLPTKDVLTKIIQEILTSNKGKMLRLDYLALEVGEKISILPLYQPQVKARVSQILQQGEDFGLWSNVPDSPECWTLDLADFPDLLNRPPSSRSTTTKKRRRKSTKAKKSHNRTRLPPCTKIDEHETLTGAIKACLREHYPKTMDAHEVLAWMYPEELDGPTKNKAYQAVSDGLNKGCSRKHWQRVEIGIYTVAPEELA